MKTHFLKRAAVAMVASLSISCAATAHADLLSPLPSQAAAAHVSADLLTRFHYNAQPLDAAMSEKIFDHFLDALDPERMIFTQADINRMSSGRAKLSAAILHEDLAIPFAMFNLHTQRLSARLASARAMLAGGFDFSQKESVQIERKNLAWPHTDAEADELWRKWVKNDWLKLRLAGAPDAKIVQTLDRRYANALRELTLIRSDDAFEVFMNAYTMAVDPHTSYMGPRSAQNFNIAMSLSLVGVGASMREKDGYDTVSELVRGGPASRSGQLALGDRIVGVGQGKGAPITNVEGLRLDETVALIRGPVDSTVVLDVLPANAPPDGPHRRVALVRKKIDLDDEVARKTLLTVSDGNGSRRIGVITLPSFYRDFQAQQRGDAHIKSVSDDVAHLLADLKAQGAQGVLIDLRDNGGGSLTEAIKLTGLFTGKGPVLQERHSDGQLVVDNNTDARVAWTGPVGVLINRNSASASEIFAAAIQDYGRGIVIGERSFGKGTVQSTVDLDALVNHDAPQFGELEMTIAQFFRIDGDTTQLRGVRPDIDFSTAVDNGAWGEAEFDNALPSFKVKPAQFVPQTAVRAVASELALLSSARVALNPDFQNWKQQALRAARQQKDNVMSLNEAERRRQRQRQLAPRSGPNALPQAGPGGNGEVHGPLAGDSFAPDERLDATGLGAAIATAKPKDVVQDEAVHVVSDEVTLLQAALSGGAKATAPTARAALPPAARNARAAGL